MPDMKFTMFFDGFQKGWTESYYTSTGDTHEQVLLRGKALASARAQLLGKECSIKAVRVSTEGVNNDAMLRYLRWEGNPQQFAAQPDVALMLRCENALHNKWRHAYLRGIWDSVETNHGVYIGKKNKEWQAAIKNYTDAITDNSWGWIASTVDKVRKVSSVARDGSGEKLIYTLVTDEFEPIDVTEERKKLIRFSGINGRSTANGLKVVIPTEPSKCVTAAPLAAATYRSGGKATFYTRTFVDIASVDDTKVVTRECGAPLLESPGRRRATPKA